MVRLEEQWAEVFAVFFVAVGFIVSVLLQSPFFSYLSVFLAGFIAGRVFYFKRFREPLFPFILIITGFLLGYLIGNLWVSRFWTLFFFIVGFALSYYLHLKKILVIFKSKSFIK